MKKLLFLNPTHQQGENLTVRRGIKWALETRADIQNIEGQRNIRTKVMPFSALTEKDLKREHDKSCRRPAGLYEAMVKAYPDFSYREIVTLVFYVN